MTCSNKLLLSIVLAFSTYATNVYAVTITAEGDYTIENGPLNSQSRVINTDTTTETSVNVSDSTSGLLGLSLNSNSAAYDAYGDQTGAFSANASGTGIYNVNSSVSYSDTIINSDIGSQDYTFNFNISPSFLAVFGLPATNGEFLTSEYTFNISLNNNSIFSSSGKLTSDINNTSFTETGTSLGFSETSLFLGGGTQYSTNGFSQNLNLGTFDSGEQFTLTYGLTASASGNTLITNNQIRNSNCNVELGCDSEFPVQISIPSGSFSSIGDPSSIGFTLSSSPTTVPEASSILLLGLGLIGLVGVKRKSNFVA